MISTDGPTDSVKPVKFKGEQRDKLVEYLCKELDTCKTDRQGMMQKCKEWVTQADSRRSRKDARPRDSNVDMPLTRKRMNQNSARLKNPVLQQDVIFVTKPRSGRFEDMARELERLIDYISDQIDYGALMDDWIEQFQTFPCGVVKTPFISEYENVVRWDEIGLDDYNMALLEGENVTRRELDNGEVKYFRETDEQRVVRRGAFPEVVPFEDFFVPMTAQDVRTADWVMHRVWLTKAQVKARIKNGMYNKKDGDQDVLEVLGDPSAQRDKLIAPVSSDNKEPPSSKQFEIMEAYLDFDVDKSGDDKAIIVTFDPKSRVILRAVYNFYHAYNRPFVTHEYKKIQGSIYGTPLTYLLEPLHVANSASFNQRLDAASLANEKIIIVPHGSELKPIMEDGTIRTGIYEGTINKDEIFEFTLSQPFDQLPQLEEKFEQSADELASLSPYSFGQEQIQRPTATGQVQIIEESKQPQYSMLERFRIKLAEVCKHVLARYKQFYPEGMHYFIEQEDPNGVKLIEEYFSWPPEVIEKCVLLETKVSSASMSKSLRKQELVALVDKMPQLYQVMMGMAQAALDPQNPSSMIAAKLLNGFQVAVDAMMTEFEVGKKDSLNPPLVQEVQVAQQIQQQMQQLTQQVNQLGQQNQQLQQKLAVLQGGPPQGQQMGGPPVPQPGMGGPMPMGGPMQGQ